ncbi:ATP synthase subunit I [Bacillaceae bacterium IKA-2]|jgi:ATP synthase protein I|nr:ATP synthase subunit I [Bacillaceae bacterium IKA-2]
MEDYIVLTKRYTIYSVLCIAIFILLAFLTSLQSIFLGLALGAVISLSNLVTLFYQVKRIGESIETGRAKFSLGTIFRTILIIGAVYIAYQYPDIFHLNSVIIGLMLTYIIIYINSLFQLRRL